MSPEAMLLQWGLPFALSLMCLAALRLQWVLPRRLPLRRRLPLPRRLARLMLGVLGTLGMLGMLGVLEVLGVLGVCGTQWDWSRRYSWSSLGQ